MKIIDKFPDPRDYQILFLTSFLTLGVINRDWTLHWSQILLIISFCLLTQILLDSVTKQNKNPILFTQDENIFSWLNYFNLQGVKSALITSLGLSLLLRVNHPTTLIFAGVCAIASKFIFKSHGKHFFNPANFGIIAVLIFTNDAWITPGQWGSDWWYVLLFFATGAMVLQKVGRWETTAVFLAVYGGLEGIYNYYLGWNIDVLFHQLMSGSLLVFAFFMLTDPRSIPNAKTGRIIWSIVIAILGFILGNLFYINNAIFWSLFIISPLTTIVDLIWKDTRFRWHNLSNLELQQIAIK